MTGKANPAIEEFFNELDNSHIETVDLDGRILVRRNNSKLHACKKGTAYVRFLCQDKRISTKYGTESLDIMDRREFVESERLCKNCKRMIQNETGLHRIVVAVDEGEPIDRSVERFADKVERTRNA